MKSKSFQESTGRRKLDTSPTPTRASLIERPQVAAFALMAGYYVASAASVFGLIEAIRRFTSRSADGDGATGLIIGLMVLILTLFWGSFTAYMGYGLRKSIRARNVHSIRRRALGGFVFALIGLIVLLIVSGASALYSVGGGLAAATLIMFAMVALAAYWANRFIDA